MVDERDTNDTIAPGGAFNDKGTSDSLAEDVGLLPRAPSMESTIPLKAQSDAQTPAKSLYPTTAGPRILGSDIEQIVAKTKLPGRKEFRALGDLPSPQKEQVATVGPADRGPEPEPPAPPRNNDALVSVHTLKDDLQSVVRSEKISLVRAAALEEDKRAHRGYEIETKDTRRPQRRRFVGTLVTMVTLLTLGAVALGAVFLVQSARKTGGENTFLSQGLLFSEQTIPFSITNQSTLRLKSTLAGIRTSSALTLGAITRLAPILEETDTAGTAQQREATLSEFFAAIDAHAPADLPRALDSTFFFGIHTVDENAPLFVIPVTSYERAFAAMLTWEQTMNADLSPVFTGVTALVRNKDGLIVRREFEDVVMRNYDIRALKDDSGIIQLYYSFPTRDYLIIAESPYSFAEILSRLRAERKL